MHVKIKDISVVSDSEHDRRIKKLSPTTEVAANESCLHKLVEDQAQRTPRFTAVEFEDQSRTYSKLNGTANRIAKPLVQQGVRQGDIVALYFDRGISQILGILSVLRAGATFVPLDPDDPTLRKELMIEECGAKVLLTTSNHSRVFQKSLASKVLLPKAFEQVWSGGFRCRRAFTFKPRLYYVHEWQSISNLVQNSGVYGFKQGVRVMSSLAYTFDPFVVDVFGTLSNGATLVTGRKELVLGDIPKAIRTLRISVLHVTPSILAVVLVDDYSTLETVVVAGEALGKKLIEDWSGRVTLRNMYGPTESSFDCMSCHVTSPSLTGVIGRPLPNCHFYILDKQLRPTPVGVEGELYIGGIQLARGYLNHPELTAAAFIANPFVAGKRTYKTGDIALYRSDGNIEYCGLERRQRHADGPTIRELGRLIVDAMSQDSRAIMEAEDADADFLIEFLPIKRRHFGSETGFGSIDAMAEHYISLTKTAQPEGPYLIGGYSYGGSMALCMATKLAKRGEVVQHLILFDPIFIPSTERQSLKSTDWTQRSIDRISSNFPDIGDKWKNKLRTEIRKNLDSMFDFEPEHYDGPTTLVVPKDRSWYRSGSASDFDTGTDDHNGWDNRIKNLDMKVAAGSHDTMFTPTYVEVLAGVVKEIIAGIPGAVTCALKPDLALLSPGYLAEVGEKSITLSGGQRARVALAFTGYARADL
ncbi:hypothetical protein HYDPIDRAFT_40894 [Hydnomerulius pinastri MD-312]|uniref:Uncharacterized protein n=1 Tax=Hydnomerulius pinastri MD-312 TaxID=994086 RepID=A0A0C9W8P1_9AGAM|nr:hypothetical protein HYDPIDRAFT_40894 [Hydnomerulius pinastri MD-312]